MKRFVVAAAVFGLGAAWILSAPTDIKHSDFDALMGDAKAGEQVFWAMGCASCHALDLSLIHI